MKPFLELLPQRLEQAIAVRTIRKFRILRQRGKSAGTVAFMGASPRRLFVDLAVISRHDAGTGIQRVVRALALALIEEAGGNWEICFVAADKRHAYHPIVWPEPGLVVDPAEIQGRPGDVFFGLDFSLDTVRRYRKQLARFKQAGGSLWFLMYDLLPAERPEWFSPNTVIRYNAWLETLAGLADRFLCISKQTEEDLKRVLDKRYGLIEGYQTSVVPMGYAIKESMLRATADEDSVVPFRLDASLPFSLMVGTIEPRKGHADILAGFSELWRQKGPAAERRLVLVGRMGWHTQDLAPAIRNHPEYGRKLMWFDDVEDLELERIYQACDGVIIGSLAEGFGLPLIEALGHDKPVLARDLPIFRIHENMGVHYFPADANPHVLAACIREWTTDVSAGRIMVARPEGGWKESAQAVLSSAA